MRIQFVFPISCIGFEILVVEFLNSADAPRTGIKPVVTKIVAAVVVD